MLGKLVTPRVWQWMRNSRSARILHLFDDVCNLVNDENDLISLVSPRIGPGPFTVVVDGNFTAGLDVWQPISIDYARQALSIGSLVVEVGGTTVWQPKPDWTRLQNANRVEWPPPLALSPDMKAYLMQTINGFVANDATACLTGINGLAGRGGGLTPTGDDVLIGILYGLWVWDPRREWMDLIVETAVPRTTTLSANFIRAAAAGEAVWQWHDLVNGHSDAISQIFAIGHTSGADAWTGFVHMCRVLMSNRTHKS